MDGKLSPSDAPFPVIATLFGLTFVTGLIDALSFLGLGHVFTANMTGNGCVCRVCARRHHRCVSPSFARSPRRLRQRRRRRGMVTNRRPRTPARHLLIAMYAEIL